MSGLCSCGQKFGTKLVRQCFNQNEATLSADCISITEKSRRL